MDYEIILNVLCIRNKNCKVRLLAFAAGAERHFTVRVVLRKKIEARRNVY